MTRFDPDAFTPAITGEEIAATADQDPIGDAALRRIGPAVAAWLTHYSTDGRWRFAPGDPDAATDPERRHRLLGPDAQTILFQAYYPSQHATPPFAQPWRIDARGAMPDHSRGPAITVAATREPEAIAGDIRRRLVPKYLQQRSEIAAERSRRERQQATARDTAHRLADAIGGTVRERPISFGPGTADAYSVTWRPDTAGEGISEAQFTVGNGAEHIHLFVRDLDAAGAAHLADALGALTGPAAAPVGEPAAAHKQDPTFTPPSSRRASEHSGHRSGGRSK